MRDTLFSDIYSGHWCEWKFSCKEHSVAAWYDELRQGFFICTCTTIVHLKYDFGFHWVFNFSSRLVYYTRRFLCNLVHIYAPLHLHISTMKWICNWIIFVKTLTLFYILFVGELIQYTSESKVSRWNNIDQWNYVPGSIRSSIFPFGAYNHINYTIALTTDVLSAFHIFFT